MGQTKPKVRGVYDHPKGSGVWWIHYYEDGRRRRVLTPEEEPRLIEALQERLRPLLLVAIHTGMRLGELLALTWKDVDLGSGTIAIREAKSGEERIAWMSPIARATLQALRAKQIQESAASDSVALIRGSYIFGAALGSARTCLWRYWQPALRKAGIEDLRFHDLRHTFATRLVARGIDIYRVKTLIGHKTLRKTERYAHVADEHLREAVERLAQ
jgi:integrase